MVSVPVFFKSFRPVSIVVAITVMGCGGDGISPQTPMKMELTAIPQTAIFFTLRGWSGGMGLPVIDDKGKVVWVDGLPVYLAPGTMDAIESHRSLPGCFQGNERIVVKARIHLNRTAGNNGSIPGGSWTPYQELVIDELIDTAWHGTPCPEKH